MDWKKLMESLGLKPAMILTYAAPLLSSYVFYKSMYKVEPGFQSLKFDIFKGVGTRVFREGYHLLIPFVQKPLIYDCRMKNHIFTCVCGTKDLQIVTLKTRLIARPDVEHLPQLYRLLGFNYEDRVLHSIVYEIAGSTLSQYNASQLINQRDTISLRIKQKLQEKAREFYIDLYDVALVNIILYLII